MKKSYSQFAEKIWKLPAETIPDKKGYHAVLQSRMFKDDKLNAYWVMCNNNIQKGPSINDKILFDWRRYQIPILLFQHKWLI